MANWVIQNSEGNAIKLVIEQINSEVKLNEKSIALKLSVYRRQETLSSILEKKKQFEQSICIMVNSTP